jgi:glucose-6-phosphate dehydrogenase assembly protein OpcA
MPHPKDALRRLAAEIGRNILISDLAWTRLTRWREMLSQVFENRERLAQLTGIRQVRVAFGGTYETGARYLATWIGSALREAAQPEVAVEADPGVPTLRVEMDGEGLSLALVRHDETLVVTINGVSHSTSLPQPTDYVLMREELGIVGHDTIYERTLASAAGLGYPTDK